MIDRSAVLATVVGENLQLAGVTLLSATLVFAHPLPLLIVFSLVVLIDLDLISPDVVCRLTMDIGGLPCLAMALVLSED